MEGYGADLLSRISTVEPDDLRLGAAGDDRDRPSEDVADGPVVLLGQHVPFSLAMSTPW